MKTPSLHLVSLSAFLAALLMAITLTGKADDTPTPQPTSQPASAPSDEGLTEGGITFNSKLALFIVVCDGQGILSGPGSTPSPQAVPIPQCRWWTVAPLKDVTLAEVIAEAKGQGIRGLSLAGRATDKDLAELSGWPNLQTLRLQANDRRWGGEPEELEGVANPSALLHRSQRRSVGRLAKSLA